MNHDSSHRDDKPWYRQFWPWFLILLPASAVVGGVTTVVIAFNNADDLVVDEWYREGKAINKSLAAEKMAEDLGLRATLTNRNGRAQLRFADTEAVSAPALRLALRHPTLAERDQMLRLVRSGPGEYRAPVSLPEGTWVVTLEPEPGDWRMRRRLTFRDDAVTRMEAVNW